MCLPFFNPEETVDQPDRLPCRHDRPRRTLQHDPVDFPDPVTHRIGISRREVGQPLSGENGQANLSLTESGVSPGERPDLPGGQNCAPRGILQVFKEAEDHVENATHPASHLSPEPPDQ